MIKYEGKEYPVSVFKIHVHDTLLDRLEEIKKIAEVKTNVEAFSICINVVYNQLKEWDDYIKSGKIPEECRHKN